ncbi:MAG: SDR family NAD(P)-dependent oxidoreductase [bacterium]|nr:SDR family NAD(P)-dependent oxidoreductase [bacterium]
MRLKDKIAIITGGGQGLGGAISRMYACEGARVVIAQRTQEKLEQTKTDIEAAGGQVLALAVDVSRPEEVRKLVAATIERFGGLDILVNNAGVGLWIPVDETDEADYDRVVDTNLKGMWMGCHYGVPHMKARGGGAIINISSVHGIQGGERNTVYAATKGGIIGCTKALAAELAPFHIRANTISPGAIDVTATRQNTLNKVKPEFHAELLERFGVQLNPGSQYFQPLDRVGVPDDIAWCAVYLASDEARFVTGQNIAVDGGVTTYLSGYGLERERLRKQEATIKELQAFVEAHAVEPT